jgi:hypothetical protein
LAADGPNFALDFAASCICSLQGLHALLSPAASSGCPRAVATGHADLESAGRHAKKIDESVPGTGRSAPPRGGRSRARLLLSRLYRPRRRRRARPCTYVRCACTNASPARLPPLARPRRPRPLAASLGAALPSPLCHTSTGTPSCARSTRHRGLGARSRCGAGSASAAPGVPADSSTLLPAAAGPFATAAPPCAFPAAATRPQQPGHGRGHARSASPHPPQPVRVGSDAPPLSSWVLRTVAGRRRGCLSPGVDEPLPWRCCGAHRMDGWMDGWMDGCTSGGHRMDGRTSTSAPVSGASSSSPGQRSRRHQPTPVCEL